MNNLSWLIYLADVSNSISAFFGISAFLLGSAAAVITIISAITYAENNKPFFPVKWSILTWISCVIMALVSTLIPSSDAVIRIAASEAGETFVNSASGQQLINDLTDVLHAQLNTLKGN